MENNSKLYSEISFVTVLREFFNMLKQNYVLIASCFVKNAMLPTIARTYTIAKNS